ncbi:protein kinase domain-containing protein [Ditylenchus destructor]|nr:protein kinase domain-containing protein [Ditylenchus destructor]
MSYSRAFRYNLKKPVLLLLILYYYGITVTIAPPSNDSGSTTSVKKDPPIGGVLNRICRKLNGVTNRVEKVNYLLDNGLRKLGGECLGDGIIDEIREIAKEDKKLFETYKRVKLLPGNKEYTMREIDRSKLIPKSNDDEEKLKEAEKNINLILHELNVMKIMAGHFGETAKGIYWDTDRVCIIFEEEYETIDHLQEWVIARRMEEARKPENIIERGFREDEARLYAGELVEFITKARQEKISFYDLHPDQIMLDKDGHIKVTKLWKAYPVPDRKMLIGKLKSNPKINGLERDIDENLYVAPEVQYRNIENEAAEGKTKAHDVWTIGLIIYKWLFGRLPHNGSSLDEAYQKILENGDFDYPKGTKVSGNARVFLQSLLKWELSDNNKPLRNGYKKFDDANGPPSSIWFGNTEQNRAKFWRSIRERKNSMPYKPTVKDDNSVTFVSLVEK